MLCAVIDFDDLRLLEPEYIDLESDSFGQATHISNQVLGEACQWQTYLNTLGLQGFTQWLSEQDSRISLNQAQCSLAQPHYANAIEAVFNLWIGGFKLCLIATENWLNEEITIPRAAIDLPEFAAHFYVVVEVQEELSQVIIRGYGRYDQLVSYRQRMNLSADDSWNYGFPCFLFDAEPNHLLFNLRFLDTAAITLPRVTSQTDSSQITQTDLNALLSHLQSSEQRLWQILPWEQGAALLQNSELLNLLYQWQQSSEQPTSLRVRIAEIFTRLTRQTINTAQWLRAELDQVSQQLGWYSLSMLGTGTPEFRSSDRFTIAIEELRYQGMDIPAQLSPVFKTIEYEGELLQIYAAAWASPAPVWSLLLILRNQMGTFLPDGLKLRVVDPMGSVKEEEDSLDTELLYVRAEAKQGTELVATIVSPTGQVLPLDPYSFDSAILE